MKIGKMLILPSNCTGSQRFLKQNYMNSMSIVNRYGKPDLFITMTCNPNLKEISENLEHCETAIDQPDIVVKVFHQKVQEFKELVIKRRVLRKCITYTYVIEFQKRGLSHMHLLLFLDKNDKMNTSEKVDELISAEIPNEDIYPHLYDVVKQSMIHGPCGEQNMGSSSMNKNTQK